MGGFVYEQMDVDDSITIYVMCLRRFRRRECTGDCDVGKEFVVTRLFLRRPFQYRILLLQWSRAVDSTATRWNNIMRIKVATFMNGIIDEATFALHVLYKIFDALNIRSKFKPFL